MFSQYNGIGSLIYKEDKKKSSEYLNGRVIQAKRVKKVSVDELLALTRKNNNLIIPIKRNVHQKLSRKPINLNKNFIKHDLVKTYERTRNIYIKSLIQPNADTTM